LKGCPRAKRAGRDKKKGKRRMTMTMVTLAMTMTTRRQVLTFWIPSSIKWTSCRRCTWDRTQVVDKMFMSKKGWMQKRRGRRTATTTTTTTVTTVRNDDNDGDYSDYGTTTRRQILTFWIPSSIKWTSRRRCIWDRMFVSEKGWMQEK
jgi:hypothetical protein